MNSRRFKRYDNATNKCYKQTIDFHIECTRMSAKSQCFVMIHQYGMILLLRQKKKTNHNWGNVMPIVFKREESDEIVATTSLNDLELVK